MSEDKIEVTEEELDAIADTAIAALQGILKYFNVGEVTIDEYEGDEGELILDITGDDLAVLIITVILILNTLKTTEGRTNKQRH